MIIDGCRPLRSIDRQPELLPKFLESLLVDLRELPAKFDEIGSADYLGRLLRITSGFEVWQVREVGVAANVEEVLHSPFRGQTVVIPPHGVEDIHSSHAALAHDQILMGVAKYVSDVEGAAYGRWRRVHNESFVASARRIPAIYPHFLPSSTPFALDFFGHVLFRQLDHEISSRPIVTEILSIPRISITAGLIPRSLLQ